MANSSGSHSTGSPTPSDGDGIPLPTPQHDAASSPRTTGDTASPVVVGDRFAFIGYAGPGARPSASTRSRIRQHAMREIGRSRRRTTPRPTRFQQRSVELEVVGLARGDAAGLERAWTEEGEGKGGGTERGRQRIISPRDPTFSPWLGVGVLDPFVRYPVEDLDPESRQLVAFIFCDDDSAMQRPLRNAWFTVGLSDEAAFFQVMSNSALHLYALQNPTKEAEATALSTRYQQRTLRSIQKRLANGASDVNEGMIGAISALMAHDDIVANWKNWNLHHDGIYQMLGLYGGVSTIEGNRPLRLTLSWVEMRGVYAQDAPPRFPLPREWDLDTLKCAPRLPPDVAARLEAKLASCRRAVRRLFPDKPQWFGLFEDLSRHSAAAFAGRGDDASTEGDGTWTLSFIHRLLNWRPLLEAAAVGGGSPTTEAAIEHVVQEVFRLGMLLFLAPAWRRYGVRTFRGCILVRKLVALLERDATTSAGAGAGAGADVLFGDDAAGLAEYVWPAPLWPLKAWALYVAAVELTRANADPASAPVQATRAWLGANLAKVLAEHGVRDWATAKQVLADVLRPAELYDALDGAVEAAVGALISPTGEGESVGVQE